MLFASCISSSVLLPIADKTTVTLLPLFISASTLSATASMRATSATEVPPNFLTISLPIKKAGILSYCLFKETIKSATELRAISRFSVFSIPP